MDRTSGKCDDIRVFYPGGRYKNLIRFHALDQPRIKALVKLNKPKNDVILPSVRNSYTEIRN
jgi:hypothetical protein